MIGIAGARAIATTSAGVSWSLGRPDGQHLTREEATVAIARIAGAVGLPVTADIEGGYDSDAIAATVSAAGAVGINLEDTLAGRILDAAAQAERIRAVRMAAAYAGGRLGHSIAQAAYILARRAAADPGRGTYDTIADSFGFINDAFSVG